MQNDSVIDLFLCHGSQDKQWVEDLASQIESETFDGTPDGRSLRVFLDKWDIDKGQNFLDRMDEGLARARARFKNGGLGNFAKTDHFPARIDRRNLC